MAITIDRQHTALLAMDFENDIIHENGAFKDLGFAPMVKQSNVLGKTASVLDAAASFAPFVASAHPSLFGLDTFRDMERPMDLAATFKGPEYTAWNSLRRLDDARFVGLTLPRTLTM